MGDGIEGRPGHCNAPHTIRERCAKSRVCAPYKKSADFFAVTTLDCARGWKSVVSRTMVCMGHGRMRMERIRVKVG